MLSKLQPVGTCMAVIAIAQPPIVVHFKLEYERLAHLDQCYVVAAAIIGKKIVILLVVYSETVSPITNESCRSLGHACGDSSGEARRRSILALQG